MSIYTRRVQRTIQRKKIPPPTVHSAFEYITDVQIAQLSISSEYAMISRDIANRVKAGTALNDIKNEDNKNGCYALTTALWFKRTGDNSYIAPLVDYIRNSPKPPDAVQALNEWRAAFGLFNTVRMLRRWGLWDDDTSLPNHGNITWRDYLLTYGGNRYDLRQVDNGTVNGRWNVMAYTSGLYADIDASAKSASNWGSVARSGNLALLALLDDMGVDVKADLDKIELILKQWLGDTTTGLAHFYSSAAYRGSWDNWSANPVNGSTYITAGVGKYDKANPGLDGVIINDIDRGGTDYDANAAQYGATGGGLTYPFESIEYVWCELAMYINAGKPVRTWGEHNNAVIRMNDRFARLSPDGTSQFDAASARAGIYGTMRVGGARISGLTDDFTYGSRASNNTEPMMPRSGAHWNWVVSGTDWAK